MIVECGHAIFRHSILYRAFCRQTGSRPDGDQIIQSLLSHFFSQSQVSLFLEVSQFLHIAGDNKLSP